MFDSLLVATLRTSIAKHTEPANLHKTRAVLEQQAAFSGTASRTHPTAPVQQLIKNRRIATHPTEHGK